MPRTNHCAMTRQSILCLADPVIHSKKVGESWNKAFSARGADQMLISFTVWFATTSKRFDAEPGVLGIEI